MTQYERDLSNLSYTNKDFGQIYPELLDLVKKISYKWDPSQSDESDPGVVLLKLAALIADKNNYNIDKNILETFPLSVTQIQNARQLFEQCGYCMKYYKSATTKLALTLPKSNEPEITDSDIAELYPVDDNIDIDDAAYVRSYVIPKFTMFSDVDNTVVYTITEDVTIKSDGITVDNIDAIQGVINTYTINGESNITTANLDYNNRLYLTELDIPENGIFVSDDFRQTWSKVDNLVLQPLGTRCYKFGLTDDGSMCYIEFPSDIDTLIGNGITINYLRTQGLEGNVGKNRITQFYTDVTATRYIDSLYTQDVTLTTYESYEQGNVYITNTTAATNGKNPETIDEAYRNYQKIKTTFETLVSLRDYENFLYTNENVSNCFVCDRTNDIQSSYKIVSSDGTTSTTTTLVNQDSSGNPELTAFDLRVYGLTYVDDPTTSASFNRSFLLINQNSDTITDWLQILMDTDSIKSIQHNYKEFEPNRMVMFMNRYPIIAKIIPQYKLEVKQQDEVINSVVSALYKVLNSRALDFGSPIEYDLVYDTIIGADPRIKAIALNDIEYMTYAVYFDEDKKLHEIRIDSESIEPQDEKTNELWNSFRREIYAKSVLAGKTQLLEPDDRFTYSLRQQNSNLVLNSYRLTTNTNVVASRSTALEFNVDITDTNISFRIPPTIDDITLTYTCEGNVVTLYRDGTKIEDDADASLDISDNISYFTYGGVTYTFLQPIVCDENNSLAGTYIAVLYKDPAEYNSSQLVTNENIVFTAPNLIDDVPYSSYVKFIHNIGVKNIGRLPHDVSLTADHTIIDANDEYVLNENEYIVFFWKTEEDEYAPYQYRKYTWKDDVKIFSPTFRMLMQRQPDKNILPEIPENIISSLVTGKQSTTDKVTQTVTGMVNNKSVTMSFTEYISGLMGSEYVLTGSNTITPKKIHTIHINNKTNGTRNVFWILNERSNEQCTLFKSDDLEYTLKTGEYFVYSNDARTQLHMLGAGTLITRDSTSAQDWSCPVVDYDEFIEGGVEYLSGMWFTIPDNFKVYATEMKFYQLGPNNSIRLRLVSSAVSDDFLAPTTITFKNQGVGTVDQNGDPTSLFPYRISYIDETGVETTLPLRNTSDTCWQGYSVLNLDVSSTKVQDLGGNQSITIYDENGDEVTTLSERSILTDRAVALTGGVQIDATTLDLVNDTIIPLGIYSYKVASNTITDNENSSSKISFVDLNTKIEIPAGENTRELEFTLPIGEYIMPIYLDAGVNELQLSLNGTKIKTVSEEDEYSTSGTHYLKFTVESDDDSLVSDCTLEIISSLQSNVSSNLTVSTLFKYTTNIDSEEVKSITKLIDNVLDTSHKFNYTYVVPDKDKITNPLDSVEFLDSNHIFNPYTICRWDNVSKLNKLVVINKVK